MIKLSFSRSPFTFISFDFFFFRKISKNFNVKSVKKNIFLLIFRWSIFALEGDEARVIQQHEAILIDILTDIFKAHKTKDVHDSVA